VTGRHTTPIAADQATRDADAKAVLTVRPMPLQHAHAVADAVIAACMPDVVEHAQLLRKIDDLRAFEREYRARLYAHISKQLRELNR
jgi:hypothetical protein